MERWEWERAHRRGKDTAPHPSFSSSLLDAIYRSIDETDGPKAATCKPQRKSGAPEPRAQPHQLPHHRNHLAGSGRRAAAAAISTSSSSESSYGGFSSSEPESCRAPPPITTATAARKAKGEGSIRSRFRPSRIYGELKKARPASPGGRLAGFLTSLFAAPAHRRKAAAAAAAGGGSACSSASSFSRSCLRGRSPSDGLRRSVRFCPVSVIVGGGDEPPLPPPPPVRLRPAAAIAAEEREREMDLVATVRESGLGLGLGFEDEEEEEEEDDVASCASSDLFELEDLMAAAGGGECCFRDELPVYETTHVRTNMAIARGLVV